MNSPWSSYFHRFPFGGVLSTAALGTWTLRRVGLSEVSFMVPRRLSWWIWKCGSNNGHIGAGVEMVDDLGNERSKQSKFSSQEIQGGESHKTNTACNHKSVRFQSQTVNARTAWWQPYVWVSKIEYPNIVSFLLKVDQHRQNNIFGPLLCICSWQRQWIFAVTMKTLEYSVDYFSHQLPEVHAEVWAEMHPQ